MFSNLELGAQSNSRMLITFFRSEISTFSPPEAAFLLVSTENREIWHDPTSEVHHSRTSRHSAHAQSQVWQIWLVLVSIYCVHKSIQNRNVVGPGQRSRFLVLTKRRATSGDENEIPTSNNKPVPSNLQSSSGVYHGGIQRRIGLLQSAYFNRFASITGDTDATARNHSGCFSFFPFECVIGLVVMFPLECNTLSPLLLDKSLVDWDNFFCEEKHNRIRHTNTGRYSTKFLRGRLRPEVQAGNASKKNGSVTEKVALSYT